LDYHESAFSTSYGNVPLHLVPAPIEVVLSLKNTAAIESQHTETIECLNSNTRSEVKIQMGRSSAAKEFRTAIVVEVES
jgi:hypothetical protein